MINLFPNQTLTFKSEFDSDEIKKLLLENTYKGDLSTSNTTTKKFIGEISNSQFKIISSKSKICVLCVINGNYSNEKQNELVINTELHKAFKILFSFWFIVLTTVIFFFSKSIVVYIIEFLGLLVFTLILRFILMLGFKEISKNVISDLKSLLKLTKPV